MNVLLTGSTDEVLLAALRERHLRAAQCEMAALDGSLGKAPDAVGLRQADAWLEYDADEHGAFVERL